MTKTRILFALALGLGAANGLKVYMNDFNNLVYKDNHELEAREESMYVESPFRTISRFIFVSAPNELYGVPVIKKETKGYVKDFKIASKDFAGNADPMNIGDAFFDEMTLVMDVEYSCKGYEGSDNFTFELETFEYPGIEKLDQDTIDDIISDVSLNGINRTIFKNKSNISFKWAKKCPAKDTTHTGVNIVVEDSENALVDGIPETPFVYDDDNEDVYIVEKYSSSTYISMFASDGTSFAWGKPKIETPFLEKNDKVKLFASGTLSVPGYTHSEDQGDAPNLVIYYDECDAESVVVRITWDIVGHKPVYIEFVKRCGSKVHNGLNIKMSSPSGLFDAVVNGVVQKNFLDGKFFLSSSTMGTTFWVSTKSAPVTISRVIVSQSPSIFKSSKVGAIGTDGAYTLTDEGSMTVNFDCNIQGTAKTTVTFVLDGYDQVDVSFTKQCSPKVAKLKSNTISSSNSIYGTSWLAL